MLLTWHSPKTRQLPHSGVLRRSIRAEQSFDRHIAAAPRRALARYRIGAYYFKQAPLDREHDEYGVDE
jgi:hypothetical protein